MKIDLHVHTRTGSDGRYTVAEVFQEAVKRKVDLISITDHDSVAAQEKAVSLAAAHHLAYITGIELNVTFEYPGGKPISLDFLGYRFDIYNRALNDKLQVMREHRQERARRILENLNAEFDKEHIPRLTGQDLENIQTTVDGAFGRQHIARYLVARKTVANVQEAFDKYLVKYDVPKYPLSLAEASSLIRNAGGQMVLAHPNDPHGTSLASVTADLKEQTKIVGEHMLKYIDGLECWHSRHDAAATEHFAGFCREHRLLMTGGSDCHQNPVLIGAVAVPDFVAAQFGLAAR